jgi:hypothetical protein
MRGMQPISEPVNRHAQLEIVARCVESGLVKGEHMSVAAGSYPETGFEEVGRISDDKSASAVISRLLPLDGQTIKQSNEQKLLEDGSLPSESGSRSAGVEGPKTIAPVATHSPFY